MTAALIALVMFAVIAIIVGGVAYVLTILVAKAIPDGSIAQIVNIIIWLVAVLIILLYGLLPLIHQLPGPG